MTEDALNTGVALVTGGAARIGRAIALRLAAEGLAVAVHYRSSGDAAAALVDEITSIGGLASSFAADLSVEPETTALEAAVRGKLGPVTCLVNNASVFERDEVDSVSRDSWDLHLETNLRAPFVLSQAMAAALPDGAEGCIINLLDQRVWNLTPHFVSYTVSKSALWTLTRTLALALAPRIRVNGIGPGPALPSRRQSDEQFAAQAAAQPLGRGTTPDEIADAAAYLLNAPAVTGQMLALDGGQHLGWAQPGQTVSPE